MQSLMTSDQNCHHTVMGGGTDGNGMSVAHEPIICTHQQDRGVRTKDLNP